VSTYGELLRAAFPVDGHIQSIPTDPLMGELTRNAELSTEHRSAVAGRSMTVADEFLPADSSLEVASRYGDAGRREPN